MRKSKNGSDQDVDALFKLPLAEFTGARNELAARLKKSGRSDNAAAVKALGKPSVSAWAVNQLYWNHREAFDKLLVSGERFHKAQKSGKIADMRDALGTRREALQRLSDLASKVLKDGGHNPSPDTIHRITTTLEGISAYASRDDGPQLGRLTHDVDPPGFESVGAFVPAKQKAEKQKAESTKQKAASTKSAEDDQRKVEAASEKKMAAAKTTLQEAKKSLMEAQGRVRSLEAAKTRSQAELKLAEKRLKEITARAERVEKDLEEAEQELEDAEHRVDEASAELESFGK